MKKINTILIILFLNATPKLISQVDNHEYTHSSIYGEMFGQGILYSINYDHRFTQNISGRIGFSYWHFNDLFSFDMKFSGFPIMINYLYGKRNHYAEIGAGLLIHSVDIGENEEYFGTDINHEKKTFCLFTSTIGYRFQPKSRGPIIRFGFTPIFNFKSSLLTGGVSLGWAF
jgi:hypothetical protein